MLGILVFIIAILGSVMIHEAGHFFTARWAGMKVHEFFVGFGPKIWSFRRGETEYGIKALPLGGYVKIAGMNPYEEISEADRHRVYRAAPAWKRAIVLVAGSFMHFVIAFVILIGIFAFVGVRGEPTLTVEQVAADSPAAAAGLMAGDEIVSVGDQQVSAWSEVVEYVRAHPGDRIIVEVRRDGEITELDARVGTLSDDRTVGYLGVGPEQPRVKESLPVAVADAAIEVRNGAAASLRAFVGLFSPSSLSRLFSQVTGDAPRTIEDPASVVGIGQQTSSLVSNSNWVGFFSLVAAFNIFIGVANLIPLPPLDGGHLAVLAYEKIRRREVDMQKLVPVTMAVILVLGSMFMLLLYLDIAKPLPSLPQ
jgi:membrane-associated protease RseP (regulator of RpoE activity)